VPAGEQLLGRAAQACPPAVIEKSKRWKVSG